MTEQQFNSALPIIRDLKELEKDICHLEAFQDALNENSDTTIELYSNNGNYCKVEDLNAEIIKDVVAGLIDSKQLNSSNIKTELEKI